MDWRGKLRWTVAGSVTLLGCGRERDVGLGAGQLQLTVVSGAKVTGSVDAVLAANLVVELKNARGSAIAGTDIPTPGTTRFVMPHWKP